MNLPSDNNNNNYSLHYPSTRLPTMKPMKTQDLDSLVKLKSILVFSVDCWGASYLRNV